MGVEESIPQGEAAFVLCNSVGHAQLKGVTDQCMANAYFLQVRNIHGKVPQVVEIQIVTGVHTQSGLLGPHRCLGKGLGCSSTQTNMGMGIGFRVKLNAMGANVGCSFDLDAVCFDEQRGSNALVSEGFQNVCEPFSMLSDLPPGLARQNLWSVRNQRDLVRPYLTDQVDEIRRGIAFNIEFGMHDRFQITYVLVCDVTCIRTWMYRDAIGAKPLNPNRRTHDVGFVPTSSVSQGGDFVYVDAEPCHPYLWVVTRKYVMRAQRILSMDLPVLMFTDPVHRALALMDELKLAHLAVVEEDVFKGTVSESSLLEHDDDALIAEVPFSQDSLSPDVHIYDIVARMAWAEVDMLPVVQEGLYLGAVDRSGVLKFLAKRAGWGFPGSAIVLEILPKDLSPTALMRIVEADGAQVTSFNVAPLENSELLEVTFKVNTEEIESLLATLRRHDYHVQSFYNAPEVEDEMRARFDAFMRFLNP